MSSNWKAIVGVLLIYIFGCFSGMVSTSIFVHHMMLGFLRHPGVALSAALEKRMTRNLDLDANQKEQIHAYFQENLTQRKDLQKQIQPQVQVLNQKTFDQIAAILRPDQADHFRQNVETFREHLEKVAPGLDGLNHPASVGQPSSSSTNSGASSPP
jgi:hypothetical protein